MLIRKVRVLFHNRALADRTLGRCGVLGKRAVSGLVWVVATVLPWTGRCAFEDLWATAQSMGMGGVGVAVVAQTDALWLNPAGLVGGTGEELPSPTRTLALSYAALYPGLSDGTRLDQSLASFHLASDPLQAAAFGWKRTAAEGLYQENTLALGLARRVALTEDHPVGRLTLGAVVRLLRWDMAPITAQEGAVLEDLDGPVQVDLSLGLLYLLGVSKEGRVPVAVAVHHLTTPNVASSASQEQELLPIQVVLGIGSQRTLTRWGLDVALSQHTVDVRLGVEHALVPRRFFLRGGLRLEGLALGTNMTFGFGLYLNSTTRLDYAYWMPLGNVRGTLGNHRFGLTYRF